MAMSDVLKKFRDMPKQEDDSIDEDVDTSTPRTILLSDEEVKALGQSTKPGEEVELSVKGRLEQDGHFHVMSVSGKTTMPDQEMGDMAAQVAGVDRAMPSPS